MSKNNTRSANGICGRGWLHLLIFLLGIEAATLIGV